MREDVNCRRRKAGSSALDLTAIITGKKPENRLSQLFGGNSPALKGWDKRPTIIPSPVRDGRQFSIIPDGTGDVS
jgi:hypothetical protein